MQRARDSIASSGTSSTKQRLDQLEERKSDLEISIAQEEIQAPLLTREHILFWLHKFRGNDVTDKEQRQRLIDCFVNAVYLYDDKMVLTFNYKDGIKHTTFDDVKSSDLDESGRPKGNGCYANSVRFLLDCSNRHRTPAIAEPHRGERGRA